MQVNPRDRVLDDHTVALIMAVFRILDKETSAGQVEQAYSDCLEKVKKDYRREGQLPHP